jgi:outer membrane cobalamin receptor
MGKGKLFLVIQCYILVCFNVLSQNNSAVIKGRITGDNEGVIPLVNVSLKGTAIGAVTDEEGYFQLNTQKWGRYTLVISCLGYESKSRAIELKPGVIIDIQEKLSESNTTINEVVVSGKSEATILREQSYAIELIESKKFKNLSTNGNDILGKISGVQIRQSGGLGSDFSISLNGLSNEQVRIFIDGVPMDYFGTSLSLNNFSANLIERIEVYKGVVPIHLSADALGGAINVVTLKKKKSFLDASYSLGSFGTQIGSVNSQYRNENSGFTLKLKSFYNKADNNYKVPVHLVDFNTGKKSDETTWVERFHDAYDSKMVWIESGFTHKKWADELLFGFMYSDNYKEIQQPEFATGQAQMPFGEVSRAEDKLITNVSYKNNSLLDDKLGLKAYLVGVFSCNNSSDTSSYRYDWLGNKELKDWEDGEAEGRKTLLDLDGTNVLGNANAEYRLQANHSLAANFSFNHYSMKGSDKFKKQNDTMFKDKSTVVKNVTGLAYTNSLLGNQFKNSVFVKLYNYKLDGIDSNYQGTEKTPVSVDKDFFGYGLSTTFLRGAFQYKASYEYAIRFPEIIELFGDGMANVANLGLLPEKSHNYNLGLTFRHQQARHHTKVGLNFFMRNANDFIRADAVGMDVRRVNDDRARSRGVDLTASYSNGPNWQFKVNGTYNDIRLKTKAQKVSYGWLRAPNKPYLLGNVQISYQAKNLMNREDRLSLTASQYYVHTFPYRFKAFAQFDKNEVDSQYPTNFDAVYSLKNGTYNVSLGIANVFDLAVYDNFDQRRPGRTFSLKFRYFIQ